MAHRLSRRALLRSSAALGGLVVLSSCAPAAAPSPAATAAASAGAASAAPKATKATGAWVALTSNQMLWPVALEAGYFKKYGQAFDLSYVSGSNNAMAAMLGGKIDMTSVAGSAVVTSAAGGEDVVLIAGFVNKMIFRVMAMPGVTSIDQLKGKTIAVTRIGTADYFAWGSIAKHQGWKLEDFQFVAANDPPGQIAVLTSGKCAAIAVSPPNNILAQKAGAHEILDMSTYNEPEQNVGIAVTRKYLTDNKDAVTANLKATIEAIARWKQDPAFVKTVIGKYLKNTDPQFLDIGYSAYKDVFPQVPYPSEEAFQQVINETATQKAKAKDLKPAQLMDTSILKEIEASGFVKKLYGQ
ncbi:MAG: ABC transporter substrate-binding protein [Chloroflexota bacterium]|nr:ABC transporter substrate-binding protein [Chloroflexota bacterium]MDE3192889.1 ABC transporter substrate-binding protein [Chloroflexota bacterium]